MTRQQTPEDLMAQLLGGAPETKTDSKPVKQDTSKPVSGDAVKPASGDAVKPASGDAVKPASGDTVKPASGDTVKPASGDTVKPVKKVAAKTTKKTPPPAPPKKATFYLDAETIDRLDSAWINLRRVTGLRAEVSKSVIANLALQFALDDLEKKGDKSHLARMLVKQYKSKTVKQ